MSFTTRRGSAFFKRPLALIGATALTAGAMVPLAGAAYAGTPEENLAAACEGIDFESSFTDIGGLSAEGEMAVNCLAYYEFTVGRTPTTFAPVDTVDRYEMALFLDRVLDYIDENSDVDVEDDTSDYGFTDIGSAPSQEARDAINRIANLGISLGEADGSFDVYGDVIRVDMARFINRIQDEVIGVGYTEGEESQFDDVPADMAGSDDIYSLYEAGVVTGTDENSFKPYASTLRYEMAFFIMRHLGENILADRVDGLAPDGTPQPGEPNVTVTGAPELVRLVKDADEADVVEFVFDENVPGENITETFDVESGTYLGLRLYWADGRVFNPTEAVIQGDTVRARFSSTVVENAVLATVVYGAVEDATGVANVEGDFALQAVAPPVEVTNPYEPQLISVDNYRLDDVVVGGVQRVLVDYTFESTADTVEEAATEDAALLAQFTGDFDDFVLVGSNGEPFFGVNAEYDAATNTFTVEFAQELTEVPESELRRGIAYDDDLELLLSEDYGDSNGITVDPDLLAATVSNDSEEAYTVRFAFDEAIDDEYVDEDGVGFWLYNENGETVEATRAGRSALEDDAATVAVVTFTLPDGFGTPVGAFVDFGAVRATDNIETPYSGWNTPSELTLEIPSAAELPAPGVTTRPDLVDVAVTRNSVTGNYSVTYTFDQALNPDRVDEIVFDLYDARGTQFRVAGGSAESPYGVLSNSNRSITFDRFDFSNEQMAAAVTAGVENADIAVTPYVTEAQENL